MRHAAMRHAPMQLLPVLLLTSTNAAAWLHSSQRARISRRGATNDDAAALQEAADALRAEAASLEATLPRTTAPPPAVVTELPGSTWRFACRLDEGKSFDFVATLERETNPDYLADDANRYREAGPLTLIDPGPSIRKAYGWLAAVWKSTGELGYRVDGVGRPKFDFHIGSPKTTAPQRANSRGSRSQ